jgi:hypothetical protein
MTIEAQQRIAAGVREILTAYIEDAELPDDYVVAAPES